MTFNVFAPPSVWLSAAQSRGWEMVPLIIGLVLHVANIHDLLEVDNSTHSPMQSLAARRHIPSKCCATLQKKWICMRTTTIQWVHLPLPSP